MKFRYSNSSSEIPFREISAFLFPLYFFVFISKQEGKPNQDSSLLLPIYTPLVKFSLCLSIYLFSFSAEKPLSLEDF